MKEKWKSSFASIPFSSQSIFRSVERIKGTKKCVVAWANRTQYDQETEAANGDDRKRHFRQRLGDGLDGYESPNSGMFVVSDDGWGISRRAIRSAGN
jgi:hypothetical protein